jgi:hypothetical protein
MRALLLVALPGCFLFRNNDGDRCQLGRTVVLGVQDDVTRVAGCKTLTGLTVRTGATIDLGPLGAELESIAGDLVVGPTVGIDEVAFNALTNVGGAVRVSGGNPSLRGLFLPRLVEAGRIAVEGNASLTTIALPRISDVLGAVVLVDNRALELVGAGELVSIGHELVILDNPKLYLVELGKLATVEAARIERDPKLPAELLDQVRQKATSP